MKTEIVLTKKFSELSSEEKENIPPPPPPSKNEELLKDIST
jgi:hypothetical protein